MNVAVLTLTRDRLEYTAHCFHSLRENAGCPFDHYVLDQGSTDGTWEWLCQDVELMGGMRVPENVGIHRGWNKLMDYVGLEPYDVFVTFDNDCEVVQPGTLKAAARIAARGDWIVSPSVRGLINTPVPIHPVEIGGERIGPYKEIGGIFRAMPGEFARSFRFDESRPIWGKDEVDVGRAAYERQMGVGYLLDWHVNHYKTTLGQQAELPEYFERKFAEMTR